MHQEVTDLMRKRSWGEMPDSEFAAPAAPAAPPPSSPSISPAFSTASTQPSLLHCTKLISLPFRVSRVCSLDEEVCALMNGHRTRTHIPLSHPVTHSLSKLGIGVEVLVDGAGGGGGAEYGEAGERAEDAAGLGEEEAEGASETGTGLEEDGEVDGGVGGGEEAGVDLELGPGRVPLHARDEVEPAEVADEEGAEDEDDGAEAAEEGGGGEDVRVAGAAEGADAEAHERDGVDGDGGEAQVEGDADPDPAVGGLGLQRRPRVAHHLRVQLQSAHGREAEKGNSRQRCKLSLAVYETEPLLWGVDLPKCPSQEARMSPSEKPLCQRR